MAERIVMLERGIENGRGRFQFFALFLYPINPVIEVNSKAYKPTPSSALPRFVIDFDLLDPPELQALDEGRAMFERRPFWRLPGETIDQVKAKMRTEYAERVVEAVAEKRESVSLAGLRLEVQ